MLRSSSRLLSLTARRARFTPIIRHLTGGAQIQQLKEANPHIDVVQYEHKNRTWTTHHVDYYAEAVAIGLAENGLIPGDVVLSWLPQHFSESVRFDCLIVD